jgi:aspartate-semialdehyde dehydrogenase
MSGKIALTHASSLLAEVLLQLITESGITPDSIVLLDDVKHYGERHACGNTHLTVGNQYEYDYEDVVAVLLLAADAELESLLQHADCAVISHALSPEARADLVDPSNSRQLTPGLNRIAGAEVANLFHVLQPLVAEMEVTSIQAVNVLSAALYGQTAVESLAAQTVALLSSRDPVAAPFEQQLAFNMLPQPADSLAQRQLAALLGSDIDLSMHSVITAALHGMVQSVDLTLSAATDLSRVKSLLGQIAELRDGDVAVSPLSDCRHGARPLVYDLRQPQNDAKRLHFWIIADSIRNGLAQNYLSAIRVLLKSFL